MKKILQPVTICAFLCTGLALLLLNLFSSHKLSTALMNADALYLPVLVDNLFNHHGSMADWYLTPAPYLFPDLFVYLFIQLFSKNVVNQVAIFSAVQVLLTACFIYLVYRRCAQRNAGHASLLATLLLVCLGLTVGSTATLAQTGNAYAFVFLSAFHYGAFLAQLIFYACAFAYIDKAGGARLAWIGLLGLASFVAALSDSIFLIQLTIPFAAVLLLSRLIWANAAMFSWPLLLVSSMSGLLGMASYKYLIPKQTKYPVEVLPAKFGQQFDILLRFFSDLFVQTPAIAVFLAAYYAIACGALFYWPRTRLAAPSMHRLRFLLAFSFVSALVTFVATTLVTNLSSGPRYVIPFFYWPVLVTIVALAPVVQRSRLVLFSAAVLAVMGVHVVREQGAFPEKTQELVEARCIVGKLGELGLKNGVAAYWDAKPLQAFSRGAVKAAQYTGELYEHRWITSGTLYRRTYDFAVISETQEDVYKISRDKIIAASGAPRAEFKCGNKSLLAYAPDQMVLEKNLFARPGDGRTWKACELQTRIGRATPACEMDKQDVALSGHMTYGPYERLPAGRYAFEIAYTSSEAKGTTVGEWDVVLALPDTAKVLRNGLLTGTGARDGTVGGEFTIGPGEHMEKFEIRTLAHPRWNLRIVHVRVDRLP